MNILTFTGLFPNNVFPNQGVFIKERIHALSKQDNVSIKVVAPVPYCPPFIEGRWASYRRIAKVEIIDGLDVTHPRYLMTPKVGMSSYGVLLCLSVLPRIKRLQKTFNFDVIDAHFLYPDGFAAVLLGKVLGKPVVVSVRGSDINRYQNMPIIRQLLVYALRRAEAVVAVSQALKKAVEALGIPEEKIVVVPNGVDGQQFFPIPKREARTRVGLPADGRIIISIGHLTENKGFDILIQAAKLLNDRMGDKAPLVVIVGEGPFRRPLERLAATLGVEHVVRFIGDIPHHDIAPWYSAADVFCLASQKEGWPNVLMESLACGTPVVATAVGGIPEIISSESVGFLVNRDDTSLAAGLERALAHSWNSDVIGKHVAQHSWDGVARRLDQVFGSIMGVSHAKTC